MSETNNHHPDPNLRAYESSAEAVLREVSEQTVRQLGREAALEAERFSDRVYGLSVYGVIDDAESSTRMYADAIPHHVVEDAHAILAREVEVVRSGEDLRSGEGVDTLIADEAESHLEKEALIQQGFALQDREAMRSLKHFQPPSGQI